MNEEYFIIESIVRYNPELKSRDKVSFNGHNFFKVSTAEIVQIISNSRSRVKCNKYLVSSDTGRRINFYW